MVHQPVFTWESAPEYQARLTGDPALLAARMRQAAVSGDIRAQLGWAHMLLEGHGTARDLDAAFRWFQLAARSGSADAINMVGRCHELGWGAARNTRVAARAYRAAAEMGHAWASFNLAALMLARDGVEGETDEILSLLVRAARRGNATAMSFIGQACEEGWRGLPKPATARRFYRRAARRGCFRGAFNLARQFMADGDIDAAVCWLRRSVAAAPGNFCTELGAYLEQHPEARLREIAELAIARAGSMTGPPVYEVQAPASTSSATRAPQSSLAARGRRSMGRALRVLIGAGTYRPMRKSRDI